MTNALAASLVALILGIIFFAEPARAHEIKRHSYGVRLIHSIDHAARAARTCQRRLGMTETRNPRRYARPHSRGYRIAALERWHDRRRGCLAEQRRRSALYVPEWFRNVMLCVHPKESTNWYLDGHHDGGLQFDPGTWRAAGGTRFAPYAYQATPEQQIRAAWDLTGGSHKALRWHWAQTIGGCL